jgi:hypothetical protein
MSWPFLLVHRRGFRDSDHWGTMMMISEAGTWEELCYTYELPWVEDTTGRSLKDKSRIMEGQYELDPRSDGRRGWRLELRGTGHRANIQIHRAHKSMSIEGCILPVDFIDFRNAPRSGVGPIELLTKGDETIQHRSVALMEKIRMRYEGIQGKRHGSATIVLAAILPAYHTRSATRLA